MLAENGGLHEKEKSGEAVFQGDWLVGEERKTGRRYIVEDVG
jgi:hypothetical protein